MTAYMLEMLRISLHSRGKLPDRRLPRINLQHSDRWCPALTAQTPDVWLQGAHSLLPVEQQRILWYAMQHIE